MVYKVELEGGGRTLTIESGKVAKQADGAVTVRYGDTMILATAVAAPEVREEQDFFPLTVDYREKAYAAGKIPGGFFKREGRPSEKETLTSRLIDRPLRPLFPEEFLNEVQILVSVLSSDQENDGDVLGIIGASAALAISKIPLSEPIGAVRIGRVNQEWVINPTHSQLEESDLNLVAAGTDDNIMMVEGGCSEISETELLQALELAHQEINRVIEKINELVGMCGKPKMEVKKQEINPDLEKEVTQLAKSEIDQANRIHEKSARQEALDKTKEKVLETLKEKYPESDNTIVNILHQLEKESVRKMILEENLRADGRKADVIRPLTCEIGVLPRTHGSALFTRGQTQSLVATTLGTKIDEQRIEDLLGESRKSYMLHYNFPPFSVGEVRPNRGPGRREIGHGALAERAIEPVIPKDELFPYTIRIVADILESNGSSSMATVCGGSLALMDAGVPIKTAVAGIAMGLIKGDKKSVVLTDISGIEDHLGDMDFKVSGTRKGITAFQMDVKVEGIGLEILKQALEQARVARLEVLNTMDKTISAPRPELSVYAPRITSIKIKPEKIGEVIGTGGKIIRAIIEQSGAKIDIEDDGMIYIAATNPESAEKAKQMFMKILEEPEMGKVYMGKVKKVTTFGAFVEIIPGQEGLVHISELDFKRVHKVEDVVNVGDEIQVKVIGIEPDGKIRLSRKATLSNAYSKG
ncbi:MAG TPA: polyribonucleotide nucleotidyltransferase [candidate division Zixibacteria bacterium]|nr:polyribonucleotide nucleotidyltransferase [candidate division Zixibacteria bacterium]